MGNRTGHDATGGKQRPGVGYTDGSAIRVAQGRSRGARPERVGKIRGEEDTRRRR